MAQDKAKDIAYVNDFQTPVPVAKYMVSLLPEGVRTVLEPTPGQGNIVKALCKAGFEVTAPGNYWDLDKKLWFDAVACNLPFSSKTFFGLPENLEGQGMIVAYKVLGQLMNMSDNIIALMPWFTISDSDVRLRSVKTFGLISVTALPRKTFQYARIQTCVLQLQRGYTGPTEFKVFDLL